MRVSMIVVAVALLSRTLSTGADVLYKGPKPVAVGTGKEEKGLIHWTYCNGKKEDFKKPPHQIVTGENCKLGPEGFGLMKWGDGYVVGDPSLFNKFFKADASKGDRIAFFSADDKSVKLDYKGTSVALDRTGDPKKSLEYKKPQ
jgi:hypothetical protein